MIEEVKAYRTSDGKLWEDKTLADVAENKIIYSERSEKIKNCVNTMLLGSCYGEYFLSVKKLSTPKIEPKAKDAVQQLFIQNPYLMEKIVKEVIKLYE